MAYGDWFQDLDGDGIQGDNEPFDWFTNEDGELEYEVAPDTGEADGQYNSNGNGVYDGLIAFVHYVERRI